MKYALLAFGLFFSLQNFAIADDEWETDFLNCDSVSVTKSTNRDKKAAYTVTVFGACAEDIYKTIDYPFAKATQAVMGLLNKRGWNIKDKSDINMRYFDPNDVFSDHCGHVPATNKYICTFNVIKSYERR